MPCLDELRNERRTDESRASVMKIRMMPVLLRDGDCFLLPRGFPFRLATDLALEFVHY